MENKFFRIHKLSNICMILESSIKNGEDYLKQVRDEMPNIVGAVVEFNGKQTIVHVRKEDVLSVVDRDLQSLRCDLTARRADMIHIIEELKNQD